MVLRFMGRALVKSTLSFLKRKLNNVTDITKGMIYIPIMAGIDKSQRDGKYIDSILL
jgi:hypothetical protein